MTKQTDRVKWCASMERGLTVLWNEGYKPEDIGIALGMGHMAVRTKAHLMGLPGQRALKAKTA